MNYLEEYKTDFSNSDRIHTCVTQKELLQCQIVAEPLSLTHLLWSILNFSDISKFSNVATLLIVAVIFESHTCILSESIREICFIFL